MLEEDEIGEVIEWTNSALDETPDAPFWFRLRRKVVERGDEDLTYQEVARLLPIGEAAATAREGSARSAYEKLRKHSDLVAQKPGIQHRRIKQRLVR